MLPLKKLTTSQFIVIEYQSLQNENGPFYLFHTEKSYCLLLNLAKSDANILSFYNFYNFTGHNF